MTEKKDGRKKMVGWYDPGQLFNTGVMTALSTVVGEYADPRMSAAAAQHGEFFDYSQQLKTTEDDFAAIEGAVRDEVWIDYAADVGDGWNSTYAVAHSLAQRNFDVDWVRSIVPEKNQTGEVAVVEMTDGGGGKSPKTLPRGEILIFGGDGVYPTASSDEYEQRLTMPYRMAFRSSEKNFGANASPTDATNAAGETKSGVPVNLKKEPHVFVLPGNHDWYDSLVAFRKLFCSHVFNGRRFAYHERLDASGKNVEKRGGWRTRQHRSYFALKLPHDWWLLGVDLQLAHSIDLGQLEYFDSVVNEMKAGSRVILCVPEPYWVKSIKYDEYNLKELKEKEKSIETLENFFAAKEIKIKAYVAGDLHHYRRFEDADRVQKITAGGGGAFLHPTHDFDFERHDEELKADPQKSEKGDDDKSEAAKLAEKRKKHFFLRKSYPTLPESKRQDWKNFWFFLDTNPKFGLVTAAVYPLLAWLLHGKILGGGFTWKQSLAETVNRIIDQPLAVLVIALLLVGVGFFTDSNSTWFKWIAGILHGIAHLAAIFALGWLGYLSSDAIVTCLHDNKDIIAAYFQIGNGTFAHLIGYIPGILQSATFANLIWFFSVLIVPAVGGYFIGATIMGVYLFISLHIFHRHDNEAFSALAIEDYKNFLRMHINRDGALTIYPMKIERVPRLKEWREVPERKSKDDKSEIEFYEPQTPICLELIEEPITIK